jgi:hypothetical protein
MAISLVKTPESISATGAGTYADGGTPGNNRLVVAICMGESAPTTSRPLASGTYGGVANTGMVSQVVSPSGFSARMTIGILYWNEAAIASRSDDLIDTTWTGGNPLLGPPTCHMYTFEGVDQTTPIDASNSAALQAVDSTTGLGISLTTTATGRVVTGACHSADTVPFAAWATVTAGNSTEYFDVDAGTSRMTSLVYTPGSTSYSDTAKTSAGTADMSIASASLKAASSSSVAPLAAAYYYNR